MVIIKCDEIPGDHFHRMVTDLHKQAQADGLVVLPFFCDLVAVTEDSELQIIQNNAESTRVAELEKELTVALAYISALKDCATCKHENPDAPSKEICNTCHMGSKWEWRGTCGNA